MAIFHHLNIADLAFMALGLAVGMLMIVMGNGEERRADDRVDPGNPPAAARTPPSGPRRRR